MIFLDNAAGSFPKPPELGRAMAESLSHFGANPGRGNYALTRRTAAMVERTRLRLSRFVGAAIPERMIFTAGATMSLNMAVRGVLVPGSHVVVSSMEHNALMRPLAVLEDAGLIQLSVVQADAFGYITAAQVEQALTLKTRLIAVSHATNVCGSVQPIAEIGAIAKAKKIPFLVDAAQSAGLLPLDVGKMHISLLALAGHKALYGPSGIGALYISEGVDLAPFLQGGTGSQSELRRQPSTYPERMEAGSLNTAGIAGWNAALDFVEGLGVGTLYEHPMAFIRDLEAKLRTLPRVHLQQREGETRPRAPLLSFTVDGLTANEVADRLDHFHICVRAGYHCAPSAHRTLGSFEEGSVRISPGWFNTQPEIERTEEVLGRICGEKAK